MNEISQLPPVAMLKWLRKHLLKGLNSCMTNPKGANSFYYPESAESQYRFVRSFLIHTKWQKDCTTV